MSSITKHTGSTLNQFRVSTNEFNQYGLLSLIQSIIWVFGFSQASRYLQKALHVDRHEHSTDAGDDDFLDVTLCRRYPSNMRLQVATILEINIDWLKLDQARLCVPSMRIQASGMPLWAGSAPIFSMYQPCSSIALVGDRLSLVSLRSPILRASDTI